MRANLDGRMTVVASHALMANVAIMLVMVVLALGRKSVIWEKDA